MPTLTVYLKTNTLWNGSVHHLAKQAHSPAQRF